MFIISGGIDFRATETDSLFSSMKLMIESAKMLFSSNSPSKIPAKLEDNICDGSDIQW